MPYFICSILKVQKTEVWKISRSFRDFSKTSGFQESAYVPIWEQQLTFCKISDFHSFFLTLACQRSNMSYMSVLWFTWIPWESLPVVSPSWYLVKILKYLFSKLFFNTMFYLLCCFINLWGHVQVQCLFFEICVLRHFLLNWFQKLSVLKKTVLYCSKKRERNQKRAERTLKMWIHRVHRETKDETLYTNLLKFQTEAAWTSCILSVTL